MRPKNIKKEYLSGWVDRYLMCIRLLCGGFQPDRKLIEQYLIEEGNESVCEIQTFLKHNCSLPWVYGVNVLDAIDILVENRQ